MTKFNESFLDMMNIFEMFDDFVAELGTKCFSYDERLSLKSWFESNGLDPENDNDVAKYFLNACADVGINVEERIYNALKKDKKAIVDYMLEEFDENPKLYDEMVSHYGNDSDNTIFEFNAEIVIEEVLDAYVPLLGESAMAI